LKFFKDKRDLNIHVEPVPLRADLAIQPATARIRLSESVSIVMVEEGRVVGRHESPPSPPAEEPVEDDPAAMARVSRGYRFTDWRGSENVFQLCSQYLDELRAVVSDGRSKGLLT
jgi:hypothetical protein